MHKTITRRQLLALDFPPAVARSRAQAPAVASSRAQAPAVARSRAQAPAVARSRAQADSGHWIRVSRSAMACRFEVLLGSEDARFVPAAREALDEADRVEAALTVFRDTSELVRVNRTAAGEPARVDDDLFALFTLCRELYDRTEGAFDITTTPLSRCWGFLQREGRLPPAADIAAALACVGMEHLELKGAAEAAPYTAAEAAPYTAAEAAPHVASDVASDVGPRFSGASVRFLRPGMELNLGSIGKGYALGRMAARLRRRGVTDALLSAGGSSVLALGGRDSGWTIDLRSRRVARRLASLRLRNGALGTSGVAEQSVEVDGTRYGHVLDPRTGWPASGVLSASVVTGDAATADALSTAFLVGGADLAEGYCAAHSETLAIVTPDDGSEEPRVFGAFEGVELEA